MGEYFTEYWEDRSMLGLSILRKYNIVDNKQGDMLKLADKFINMLPTQTIHEDMARIFKKHYCLYSDCDYKGSLLQMLQVLSGLMNTIDVPLTRQEMDNKSLPYAFICPAPTYPFLYQICAIEKHIRLIFYRVHFANEDLFKMRLYDEEFLSVALLDIINNDKYIKGK